jgi:ABC-2 type transport system ATP-binding protein
MIQISNVTKKFGNYTALKSLNCTIEEETIYGLIGSNGAGKSTLLRLISGIYRADEGRITINEEDVFENTRLKSRIFFLSDELYFLPHATMNSMAKFYNQYYNAFNEQTYRKLCSIFPLNPNQRISTFSKGMQRQAGLILAISCCPDILLLDEAFDGLDPVIRNAVRRILIEHVARYNMTVIISSHNLRELEDLCDHIGLLHKGGILLDKDIDSLKLNLCKFHCGFTKAPPKEAFDQLNILKFDRRGNLLTFTAKGHRSEIESYLETFHPLFLESIPLTLEEVFIQEMEEAGYGFGIDSL